MANIYLDPLDKKLEEFQNVDFVRYSDNILIFAKTKQDAEKVRKFIKKWLNEHGLKLKQNKPKILDFKKDKFEFLGFEFNSGNKKIRQSTILKTKRKIKRLTFYSGNGSLEERQVALKKAIRRINSYLGYLIKGSKNNEEEDKRTKNRKGYYINRGWISYFASVADENEIIDQLKELDCYTRDRLRYIIGYDGRKRLTPEEKEKQNIEFYKMGLRSFVGTFRYARNLYKNS